MRIVITGSEGQLGRALRAILHHHTLLNIDLPEYDITNYDQMISLIPSFRPHLVIHAAAFTNVDGCESEPDTAYKVNALGTQNIALACQRSDVPMVYISTDYVFDGTKGEPYLEWDTPNPQSVYAKSKYAGELITQLLLHKFYIVRTAWLYGTGSNNFVAKVLRNAAEHPTLQYVTDEVGSPTYAPDLAQAIAKLVEHPLYGIYHFTNQGTCSRYEWAVEILHLAGKPDYPIYPTQGYTRAAKVPAKCELRNFVGATQLGITLRPWKEALADWFAEYRGAEWRS